MLAFDSAEIFQRPTSMVPKTEGFCNSTRKKFMFLIVRF